MNVGDDDDDDGDISFSHLPFNVYMRESHIILFTCVAVARVLLSPFQAVDFIYWTKTEKYAHNN